VQRFGVLLTLALFVTAIPQLASAYEQPSKGADAQAGNGRSLDVSGTLEVPGIGTVNLGEKHGEEAKGRYRDERKEYAQRALEKIHALALANMERPSDTFAGYVKARNTLSTIRVVADIFSNDPYFRSISTTAAETLESTKEQWGPFDEDKVYSALKTIAKTTL